MKIDNDSVHPKFKFNGNSYSEVDLKELGYDLIKEGTSFENSIGDFLLNWFDENPTLAVETSGSTGKPKIILLQKSQMVDSARATGEYFNLTAGKTALLCLPIDYIAGKMMLVRAIVLGLELDCVKPSSNPLEGISKTYDFGAMIPLQLENSLATIEIIKTLIVGGAVVSKALAKKAQEKSTAIFETYGMTETITHVAVRAVSSGEVENKFKALPNVTFSKDQRDCLVISALKVSDNTVVTNDIVNLISETEFEWLGRYDNVINSGGIKLFPEQIEIKLAPLLSSRFFLAGMPDEKLGQKLVLVVEGEIDKERLLQKLKKSNSLERFETPKTVCSVSKFVQTDTGKILRKENLLLVEG